MGKAPRSRPKEGPPRIYIAGFGNCQAMFLTSVLAHLPDTLASFFDGPYRHVSFEGKAAATRRPDHFAACVPAWKQAGGTVIVVEQTSPVAKPQDFGAMGIAVDHVVRFPNVEAFVLWPEAKYEADKIARLGPKRMFGLDRAATQAGSNKADFSVGEFYETQFTRQILFDSPRHPSALFLAHIAGEILTRLKPFYPDLDVDAWRTRVAQSRGINTVFKHPVPEATTSALGCSWGDTQTYRLWREATETFLKRDHAGARDLLQRVLDETPDDPFCARLVAPDALVMLSTCLDKLGDEVAAEAAVRRAVALDPSNPLRHHRLAKFLFAKKSYTEAEQAAVEACTLNPDGAIHFELAATIQMARGRLSEARDAFNAVTRLDPKRPAGWRGLASVEMRKALTAIDDARRMLADAARGRGRADPLMPKMMAELKTQREDMARLVNWRPE